jgi:hypothetical protein
LSHFEIISSEIEIAQPTFAEAAWKNVFSHGILFISSPSSRSC